MQTETQEGPIEWSSARVTIRVPSTGRYKTKKTHRGRKKNAFENELDRRFEAARKGYQQEKEEPEGEKPWGRRIPQDKGGGGLTKRSPYQTGRTRQPKSQSINHLGRAHHKAGGHRTRRS